MRPRPFARLALVLACAAVAAGCGNSASGQTNASKPAPATAPAQAAAPSSGPVSVKLSEFKIQASTTSARAGKVSFRVTNVGNVTHEFVVLRTAKPAGALGKGTRIPETGHVGETGDVKPGASKEVTLTMKPGHYSLVCNLPGHYMGGMHVDFTVQ